MTRGLHVLAATMIKTCIKFILGSILSCVVILPASAETIKVGAIFALTGGASLLGGPELRSVEMVVDKVNKAGGINGNPIELIVKDSGTDEDRAAYFANQLIKEEKVVAILGPTTSGETMKVKKIAEQGKTPLISCGAAEVIVNPVAGFVFNTAQKDSYAVKKIYGEMKNLGIGRIAVLVANTGFGKAGKTQLLNIAPRFNIEVVAVEVYDKQSADLSELVAKLMTNGDIEAVVNWSNLPTQATLAKDMRAAGWQVPLFLSHAFGNRKYIVLAGAAAENIIFPAGHLLIADTLPDSNPRKTLLLRYKNDYEHTYNEAVSTFGGHGYDAITILVKALSVAGNDRQKVRDAIENLETFAGLGGFFNFSQEDHNGLDFSSIVLMTVKNGTFAVYEGNKRTTVP